ncbi:hypothetical protein [Sphingomonas gilva]|nr:hypothetical protein [Sphingomonas gilva]
MMTAVLVVMGMIAAMTLVFVVIARSGGKPLDRNGFDGDGDGD